MAAPVSSQSLLFKSFCLFLTALSIHAPPAASLDFSLDFSDPNTSHVCDKELRCERDAHMGSRVLELTKHDKNGNLYSVGRASYNSRAVQLWDNATGEVASFISNFTFQIRPLVEGDTMLQICSPGDSNGDGMAFFLANYPSKIPPNSYAWNLALFNGAKNINATDDNRVVAVEFDTISTGSPFYDPSSDHVGIDINSIVSTNYTNVSKGLYSEDSVMTAEISYDNLTGILTARLRIDNSEPYEVTAPVDMKQTLPEQVAVGFAASSGRCIELHQVLSWSFSSTLQPVVRPSTSSGRLVRVLVPTVVGACLVLLIIVVGYLVVHRRRTWKRIRQQEAKFESGVGPRKYTYSELAAATSNFAEEKKLGRGGFGNVYRGKLSGHDRPVAVKMLSAESSAQGRREFEAEVKIISRLRHRNLVQLLGWCDRRKGLLLVYELMPEGSLDQHLYNNTRLLTWIERYKIILGLGSAMRYLHTECEQCVLHGDIKPSNILLDSLHSTKLADFGLARLVDHGAGARTTQAVKGTLGYIDPEFIRTQRPSMESDVYSFGVVLLEIVSGRHPTMQHPDKVIPLLTWIRDLYDGDSVLEAVDERLRGGNRGRSVDSQWQLRRALQVGLWCTHPDTRARPSIVHAMSVLQSEDLTVPVLSWHANTTSDFTRRSSSRDASWQTNVSGRADASLELSGGR